MEKSDGDGVQAVQTVSSWYFMNITLSVGLEINKWIFRFSVVAL